MPAVGSSSRSSPGSTSQDNGQFELFLFAIRQLAGHFRCFVGKSDQFEQFPDLLAVKAGAEREQSEGVTALRDPCHLDIFEHHHPRGNVDLLERTRQSPSHDPVRRHAGDRRAVEYYATAVGPQETGDEMEKRGFAGAWAR